MYFIKSPFWLKKIYNKYTWDIPDHHNHVYLTFDDGPHAVATPFVLQQLYNFNAKATFFCIGKNIVNHPDLYQKIIDAGHTTGNHTHNHLNGWKTDNEIYINNTLQASQYIHSTLFRPPYGRIRFSAAKSLIKDHGFTIIMWDVLSADFDTTISPEKCFQNVIKKVMPGSIIVFHDSAKAFNNLQYALPKVLEYFTQKNFVFKSIDF